MFDRVGEIWSNIHPPSRRFVLLLCIMACVANIILVGALAGGGILKSTEMGDIQYTESEITPDGNISVPEDADYRFAVERPTDADAFYNAVVRVKSGGPLFNTWQKYNIQEFHYHPVTFFGFAIISIFGYVWFKVLLFLLSVFATVVGTWLLLDAETSAVGVELSQRYLAVFSLSSVGFAPMVANFKVGQVTPFAFLCAAVAWWSYRRSDHWVGGMAIALATLVKPYWAAPAAIFASSNNRRWQGILGFCLVIGVMNIISTVTFGFDTTMQYYEIILDALLRESESPGAISTWSVEAINLFWFLSDFAIIARLLTAVPFVWLFVQHVRQSETADMPLYTISFILLFTVLGSTTLIDLGLILAPFIVFGVNVYRHGGWPFAALGGAFLLAHAHTYVMEIMVGSGHPNLSIMLDSHPALKLLQPGVYAVLTLYALTLWWIGENLDMWLGL